MKKLIDIPEEIVKDLKKMAIDADMKASELQLVLSWKPRGGQITRIVIIGGLS